MDLSKFVAISGKPGIFRVVSNRDNGLVVEDLDTGKKRFVSGRIHQFTPLKTISIYTESDTEELEVVFDTIKAQLSENPPVATKASNQDTKDWFRKILPDFDEDRVYVSDIRKIIKWFNFLDSKNLLESSSTEESDSQEEE
ncbi:MAG: DUF5606 domain-containing protein [Bacteroidota bacterium]